MENALRVSHVSKDYPGFSLKDISFELPKGSVMGLIGQNGAGKTTTLKSILGLVSSEGEIEILGSVSGKETLAKKEEIGVVFDEMNFYETLTPEETGKIFNKIYKNWDRKQYQEYLKKFRLPEKKEIKTFSKGMQVKLSLAVALSHHAKLLILDEATSGLDPVMRDEILDIFLDFVQDEEHSILVSSHITSDLEKIADYITFIDNGRVLMSKPKDELIYEYGIARCKESQFLQMDQSEILTYRKQEYQYEVLVDHKEQIKRKYPDMVVDHATLEEIMLLYIKGERK